MGLATHSSEAQSCTARSWPERLNSRWSNGS